MHDNRSLPASILTSCQRRCSDARFSSTLDDNIDMEVDDNEFERQGKLNNPSEGDDQPNTLTGQGDRAFQNLAIFWKYTSSL